MSRFQLIDGATYCRADQLVIGDRVDFEGDKFADPTGDGIGKDGHVYGFEFEFGQVVGKELETPGCIRIDTDQAMVGFPPDHLVKVDPDQPEPVYYDCGICEHYHPNGFHGDCRDDANRYTAQELDDRHGPEEKGWRLIAMDEAD